MAPLGWLLLVVGSPTHLKKNESNWIISPGIGAENKTSLKPPTSSWVYFGRKTGLLKKTGFGGFVGGKRWKRYSRSCFFCGPGLAGRLWFPIFLAVMSEKNAFSNWWVDSLVLGFNQFSTSSQQKSQDENHMTNGYFTGPNFTKAPCETRKECRMR